jgi:predicted transcriptional regulator
MARPRAEQPTPAELQVLKILWGRGRPSTVRDVLGMFNALHDPPRAYTSVMSLMNVMAEKGLLHRAPQGRAFVYRPAMPREETLRSLLGETLERAYEGSASLLMAHLLDRSRPSGEELDQIRALLDEYEQRSEVQSPAREGGPTCRPPRPRRSGR